MMPASFQAITPSLPSGCRCCTPGNTSGSSSPLASWECERLPGTPRISHTLAARIQFESRASDRTRSLPLLRRLLEPIEKPLDFRFRQTHLSVFHPDRPKRSVADQAAERLKGNAKAFGGLAASEDLVSRIGRIERCQSAPLSAPGCSSQPWSCTAAEFSIAGYLYAGRSGTEMQAVLSLAAGWCCFWRN